MARLKVLLALLVTDFCSAEGLAPPYMHALVTVVAENDVELRILLESSVFNGLENRIGIRWFLDELAKEEGLNNVANAFLSPGTEEESAVMVPAYPN
jgi:hypothetical protein